MLGGREHGAFGSGRGPLLLVGLLLLGMTSPLPGQSAPGGAIAIDNTGAPPAPAPPSATAQQAGFTDFTDFAAFQAASGPLTCIPFSDLAPGTLVTTQYASVGVTFTDGDDAVLANPGFVRDGIGLDDVGRAHLEFDRPHWTIGVFFPGALQIELFDFQGGTSLYTSQGFGYEGPGHFGGVVSTGSPFTFVELRDWRDDIAFEDDICFGLLQDPTAELEAKLDLLEPKVDAVDTATTTTREVVERLEAALEEVKAEMAALEGKSDGAEGKLDGLEVKADRAEGKLDGLEVKADRAEGKLDAQTQAIALLEGKSDRAEGKLDHLEAKIDSLQKKIEGIELLLCELNRLLLTPEGQRESNACGPCVRFPDGKVRPGCPPAGGP
jgi:hypothetical protein